MVPISIERSIPEVAVYGPIVRKCFHAKFWHQPYDQFVQVLIPFLRTVPHIPLMNISNSGICRIVTTMR